MLCVLIFQRLPRFSMNVMDKCLLVYHWKDTSQQDSTTVLRDKQWKSFHRQQNYFNPISIKKLDFKVFEQQDDGDYVSLHPDSQWYMVLEITTVNVKEKPKDRELQILQALEKLLKKIDTLNQNVQKLPDKPPEENPKKFSFGLLVALLASLLGGFIWWVNKSSA